MNRAAQENSRWHSDASAARLMTRGDGIGKSARAIVRPVAHRAEPGDGDLAVGKFRRDDAAQNFRHAGPGFGGGRAFRAVAPRWHAGTLAAHRQADSGIIGIRIFIAAKSLGELGGQGNQKSCNTVSKSAGP